MDRSTIFNGKFSYKLYKDQFSIAICRFTRGHHSWYWCTIIVDALKYHNTWHTRFYHTNEGEFYNHSCMINHIKIIGQWLYRIKKSLPYYSSSSSLSRWTFPKIFCVEMGWSQATCPWWNCCWTMGLLLGLGGLTNHGEVLVLVALDFFLRSYVPVLILRMLFFFAYFWIKIFRIPRKKVASQCQ